MPIQPKAQWTLEEYSQNQTSDRGWVVVGYESPALYPFTSFTFNPCGNTGYIGPTYPDTQGPQGYPNQSQPWTSNQSYFDISGPTGSTPYNNSSLHPEGYQIWTVPGDGTYRFAVQAASGGRQTEAPEAAPGYLTGAFVSIDYTLEQADIIVMVVGQYGNDHYWNAGGGGGSFVTKVENGIGDIPVFSRTYSYSNVTLIAAAGGGGGHKTEGSNNRPEGYGQAGQAGGNANYQGGGRPGGAPLGHGGETESPNTNSSGGAGYLGNTTSSTAGNTNLWTSPGSPGNGAWGFLTGARGSNRSPTYGGFGGGGHGSYSSNDDDDGGGGGYSGGSLAFDAYYAGGGGGSYTNPGGSNFTMSSGYLNPTAVQGYITVTLL